MSLPSRVVVVHGAGSHASDTEELVRVAVGELGVGDPGAPVRRHCPACGSSDHGRPWFGPSPGQPQVHMSVARCRGRSVVAVTVAGPVGVDVELAGSVQGRDVEAVLGPGPPGDPTLRWVRAEAALKAAGRGLARVGVDEPESVPAWTSDLYLAPRYEAALAVLTTVRAVDVDIILAAGAAREARSG